MLEYREHWIDLCKPTDAERKEVEAKLGFRIPAREIIREIELSSRVRITEGALFLNVPNFYDSPGNGGPLGFVLTADTLVTQRGDAHRILDDLVGKLAQAPGRSSTDLFLRMFEQIVDDTADLLEKIEAEVAHLTRKAFQENSSERALKITLRRVGELGSQMARTHNSLLDLSRVTTHLHEKNPPWFDAETTRRLDLVHGDLRSLIDFEEQLGTRVQFLLDGVLGQINIDQNEIMKVMTVASVVGVPPTVLVGVWGMNFKNMPELEWHYGYFIALAIVFLSGGVPLLWFHRKGWI